MAACIISSCHVETARLSEMTLEGLWELFPIFPVVYDDWWKDGFNEIENALTDLFANQPAVRISHIESTAIEGMWAKEHRWCVG